MALQTFNFMQPIHTPDYSGLANIFQNYYKGYEAARTPKKLEQEELARQLQNAILGTHAEYLPGKYQGEAELNRMHGGLYEAQTKQALTEEELKRQDIETYKRIQQAMGNRGMPSANAGLPGGNMPQLPPEQQQFAQQMQQQQQQPGNFVEANQPGYNELAPQAFAQQQQQQGMGGGMPPQQPQAPQLGTQMHQNLMQQGGGNAQTYVLNPGDPSKYELDNLFDSDPKSAKMLADMFKEKKVGTHLSHNDQTGETRITKNYPSGKVVEQVFQTGRKPEDIEAAKKRALLPLEQEGEYAKADVEAYKENQKSLRAAYEQNAVNDEIGNLLNQHPEEMNQIIGVIYGKQPDATLSAKAGRLRGRVTSLLGTAKVDTGKDIKGSWNARDDKLASQANPQEGDTFPVFQGKWAAKQLIDQQMRQRRILYAHYMRDEGMPDHKAAERAEQETSLEAIRPQVEKMIKVPVVYKGETIYVTLNMLDKALDFGAKEK